MANGLVTEMKLPSANVWSKIGSLIIAITRKMLVLSASVSMTDKSKSTTLLKKTVILLEVSWFTLKNSVGVLSAMITKLLKMKLLLVEN